MFAARSFHIATRVFALAPPTPGPVLELETGFEPVALAALTVLDSEGAYELLNVAAGRLAGARRLWAVLEAPTPVTTAGDAQHLGDRTEKRRWRFCLC